MPVSGGALASVGGGGRRCHEGDDTPDRPLRLDREGWAASSHPGSLRSAPLRGRRTGWPVRDEW